MAGKNEAPRRGGNPADLKAVAEAMARAPADLAPLLGMVETGRRAFICLYLWGDRATRLNAMASARAAGFGSPQVAGHRLRRDKAVGALIDAILDDRLGETGRRRAS
jgi:hypothetical protein